jgi:hypothetical protein
MNKKKIHKFLQENFDWLVLGGFFLFALINILHHELWRDEMQTWMLAKASSSLSELFANSQFERHPRLWHLSVFLLTRIFNHPIAMQLFHLCIASCVIFIFLRYSLFSRLQKVLFTFGYFPLYEYATISRDYSLGILFIFLFLALYPKRKQNYLAMSVALFFMAQTTAWAMLFSMCFAFILIIEPVIEKNYAFNTVAKKKSILPAICIFLAGIFLSLLQMRSPDSGLNNIYEFKFDPSLAGLVLETVWKSFVPIHNFSYNFWNSNFLGLGVLRLFFSFLIFFCAGLVLFRKRLAFIFFLCGTIGVFVIMYQFHVFMYLRYSGHLFILFIVSLWLAKYFEETLEGNAFLKKLSTVSKKFKNPYLISLLALQLFAGITASLLDWNRPFTAAPEVAKYIKEKNLDNMYMVGDLGEPATVVSGYLDGKMYYPRHGYYGSFMIFKGRDTSIKTRKVIAKARDISQARQEDILLVLNWQVNKNIKDVQQIAQFEKSIVADEKYYLHILKYDHSPVEHDK